ncbi:unnamed protein product, partial [Symbiodinium necroappetens]
LERGVSQDEHGQRFACELHLASVPAIPGPRLAAVACQKLGPTWAFPSFGRCHLVTQDVQSLGQEDLDAAVREAIFSTVAAARAEGFHVQVCRHDLFHGHLFRGERGEVGILLHACEYPSQNDDFPVNLGFCQADTQVKYEDTVMQHRNILLLFSRRLRAFVLDAESDCVKALIPEYARKPMYTLYEDTLGEPLADMYFLSSEEKLGWVQRRSSKVHL